MAAYEIDSQAPMPEDELQAADRPTQLRVMEIWFRERFEDPAERTPYESAEGGYIWIWGGPYDAREELEGEFSNIVPDSVIDELASQLEGECYEWAPTENPDDYDDSLIRDIARITEYHKNFTDAILDIEKLLETNVDPSVSPVLYRLLFVNTISAFETYLSTAFINLVVNTPGLMRRFIETTPAFRTEKVLLSDIFKAMETVEKKAKSHLYGIVWHRLDRIIPMYKATLGVEFPSDIKSITDAITDRHDIVHRNGKTMSGRKIIVTPEKIEILIRSVENFVENVDRQLASVKAGVTPDHEENEL